MLHTIGNSLFMGTIVMQRSENEQAVHFLQMVDEMCRRAGGKHLLTRGEYLEIVNHCYREIYGIKAKSGTEFPAQTG